MKKVLTLFLLISTIAHAQFSEKRTVEFVEAGFFIHSISLPFKASNGFIKLNRLPGFKIGASISLNDNNLGLSYRPSLAFYHQKKLHYGLHFNNQFALSYPKDKKLATELLAGVGYLHTFEDAPLYKIEQGVAKKKKDWGRPQFTISIGIGFGVNISKKSGLKAFIQQEIILQLPFASKAGITTIMHNRTHLSVRKYF